jgi:hypothetical protein
VRVLVASMEPSDIPFELYVVGPRGDGAMVQVRLLASWCSEQLLDHDGNVVSFFPLGPLGILHPRERDPHSWRAPFMLPLLIASSAKPSLP